MYNHIIAQAQCLTGCTILQYNILYKTIVFLIFRSKLFCKQTDGNSYYYNKIV